MTLYETIYVRKSTRTFNMDRVSEKTLEKVAELAATRIESIFTDPSKGKVRANLFLPQDCNLSVLDTFIYTV